MSELEISKDSLKEARDAVLEVVSSNIEACKETADKFIKSHKWEVNRVKDNYFLDCYILVLENQDIMDFYKNKIKRSRTENSLVSWAEEYSSFFTKVERDLINMRKNIFT